jgi:hypothetical protein
MNKLLELSKRGVGGEADNAKMLLEKLMAKYNLTYEDLEKNEIKTQEVSYKTWYEEKLIYQVMYMMFPLEPVYTYSNQRYKRNRNKCILKLTDSQFIEFQYAFSIYLKDLEDNLRLFCSSFIQSNHIFPNEDNLPEDRKANGGEDMSYKDMMKMSAFAQYIDKSQIRKAIGGN